MKKRTVIAIVVIIELAILAGFLINNKIQEKRVAEAFHDAKYISYQIQPGDTLWDIAEEHNQFEVGTRDYVEKIRQINNIHGDLIRSGNYLILVVPNN